MRTVSIKSWELTDKEADLRRLFTEFLGTDQEGARIIVEVLSSLYPVTIRVPKGREIEFVEKMKGFGAHISN
jgi:hypothetical protein